MKNILKFLIFSLVLTLVFPTSLVAQKKNRITQKADRAFDAEMYFEALELYKKAYKKTKNKAIKSEIFFKQAECYRFSSKFKQAANFYKKAIKAKYNNSDAIAILRYAEMLMITGNYEKSLEQFKKYKKKVPTDIKAEKGIKSCEYAINWMNNPTDYVIETMRSINSKNNDFSPAFGNKDYTKIYFVSSRKGSSNDIRDERTGEPFTDIYSSSLNKKDQWIKPVKEQSPINSDAHEGTLCLNEIGTTMFFTTCQAENKKTLGCAISISQLKGKIWGSLNKLQIKVDSNTTIGHPTISLDENTIIFSADMSGGYGGKDLWIVTKWSQKDGGIVGQWSDPANLGPAVNTDGDEMFPFLRSDGSLYFASNGHVGMGGFDIYKSELNENGIYSSAINLKYPINSSADDFGMIVERKEDKGYFTSNRKLWIDADGKEIKQNGSDNIYQFVLVPPVFTLQGVITDANNGDVVAGATVKLVGDDGSAIKVISDNLGQYNFDLNPLTTYEIVVSKKEYLNAKSSASTVGMKKSQDLREDIVIVPIKKEIILPKVYYDFAKWDLRDTSKLDLDLVFDIMTENPNVTVGLYSHTDFRGNDKQNIILSQRRAEACIKYLVDRGIASDRLVANGMGESSPYVVENRDGRFKVGDVLTELYINKIRFKKNKDKAHQYNRRTTFKVLSEDYVPTFGDK